MTIDLTFVDSVNSSDSEENLDFQVEMIQEQNIQMKMIMLNIELQ